MQKRISIALDGPAGSGKSTIAKLVAHQLNYTYIDTGAMYRAITLKALRQSVDLNVPEQLTRLAEQTAIDLQYQSTGDGLILRVILDGEDVSEAIRSLEVTNNVSVVAAVAGVRVALVKLQQQMAREGGVVMDGRDIGTVVLPDADLKVFLTASVAERGKRRWLELQAKGVLVELEDLIQQIERRDYFDSHRETDPLRQAPDALLLDTTDLTIDQVVRQIMDLALAKGAVL
ncbi:MAG TPA: (d)CMP kinase [Bacillota bacterium]|nr:(d)CMP kinase [Bacillota bacterium]